jgi:hypothetical protein
MAPSWKYILNYETEWMNRDEIVYSTYEAGKRLNRLKGEFGLIDPKTTESVEMRLEGAVQMMKEIDRVMALPDAKERGAELDSLSSGRLALQHYSMSTICEKKELEWPTRFIRMNFIKILKTLLVRRKPNVSIPSSTGAP